MLMLTIRVEELGVLHKFMSWPNLNRVKANKQFLYSFMTMHTHTKRACM